MYVNTLFSDIFVSISISVPGFSDPLRTTEDPLHRWLDYLVLPNQTWRSPRLSACLLSVQVAWFASTCSSLVLQMSRWTTWRVLPIKVSIRISQLRTLRIGFLWFTFGKLNKHDENKMGKMEKNPVIWIYIYIYNYI